MHYGNFVKLDEGISKLIEEDASTYAKVNESIQANRNMLIAVNASKELLSVNNMDHSPLNALLDANFLRSSIASATLLLNICTPPEEIKRFRLETQDIKNEYTIIFQTTSIILDLSGKKNPNSDQELDLLKRYSSIIEKLRVYPKLVKAGHHAKLTSMLNDLIQDNLTCCGSPISSRYRRNGDIFCCDVCGEVTMDTMTDENKTNYTETLSICARSKNGRDYFETELRIIAGIQSDDVDTYVDEFINIMRERGLRSDQIYLRDVYTYLADKHPSKKKHSHKVYYLVSSANNDFIVSNIQRLIDMYDIYIRTKIEMVHFDGRKQDYNNIKFLIYCFLRVLGVNCTKTDIFPRVQDNLSDQYSKLRPIANKLGWDLT